MVSLKQIYIFGFLSCVVAVNGVATDMGAPAGAGSAAEASDALLYAVKHQRELTGLKKALIAGADVAVVDLDGNTALHLAGRPMFFYAGNSGFRLYGRVKLSPSIEILELLIRHGAPVFAVNNEGKTAEQVARENGFIEAADFLAQARRWSPLRASFVGAVMSAQIHSEE
jgi:ankyrin repeat protein